AHRRRVTWRPRRASAGAAGRSALGIGEESDIRRAGRRLGGQGARVAVQAECLLRVDPREQFPEHIAPLIKAHPVFPGVPDMKFARWGVFALAALLAAPAAFAQG